MCEKVCAHARTLIFPQAWEPVELSRKDCENLVLKMSNNLDTNLPVPWQFFFVKAGLYPNYLTSSKPKTWSHKILLITEFAYCGIQDGSMGFRGFGDSDIPQPTVGFLHFCSKSTGPPVRLGAPWLWYPTRNLKPRSHPSQESSSEWASVWKWAFTQASICSCPVAVQFCDRKPEAMGQWVKGSAQSAFAPWAW